MEYYSAIKKNTKIKKKKKNSSKFSIRDKIENFFDFHSHLNSTPFFPETNTIMNLIVCPSSISCFYKDIYKSKIFKLQT